MWKLVLILVSCVFVTTSCSRVPETGNSGEDRLPVITPKEVRVRAAATFDDHVEERRMGKPMKLERDEEEGATSWQFLSSASSSTSSEDPRAKGGQEKKGLHGENEEGTNDGKAIYFYSMSSLSLTSVPNTSVLWVFINTVQYRPIFEYPILNFIPLH